MSNDELVAAGFRDVSTATVSTVLLKAGLRNVWLRGPKPLRSGQPRIAGPAFTLRFLPMREDLTGLASLASPTSTRAAIEEMPEGCIAVADAMGVTDAGIFGDILVARMGRRGVAGLVTDGVTRDAAGVLQTGLPVWCDGVAAPPSIAALTFIGWQQPIACGGVAIMPGDWLLADDDGAVVIPANRVDETLEAARRQEREEAWIMRELEAGASLPGLYPMDQATRARYENSDQ